MNILIYFPYNQRTVEQQSVMEMFIKNGHRVFLLTLSAPGPLHQIATAMGVTCLSSGTGEQLTVKNVFTNARLLIKTCKQHQINVVLAHQQICALPLIIAKPFIKAQAFYIRHNTDEGYAANPAKAKMLNGFINRWSKNIIAPSNIVYNFLHQKEGVPANKMRRINYGYNFDQYEKPIAATVENIRQEFAATLLIVSVARLVEAKRHIKMFSVVQTLVNEGLDCKMICLGAGSLKNELEKWIVENNMTHHIYLMGIKSNVLDYLSAGDLLLHLSETEASNSVVKEAGLVKKAAIVCKGVGDFEDYIEHNVNGFLTDKDHPEKETADILRAMYHNKVQLQQIGANAQQTITTVFDIKNVAASYLNLLN
jgi:glycosyltransferase involved in cell wall biosynthesis